MRIAERDGRVADAASLLTALRADAAKADNRPLLRRVDAELASNRGIRGDFAGCYSDYLRLRRDGVGCLAND